MKCNFPECPEEAVVQIKLATSAETDSYCLEHGQRRRQQLDSQLVHYTFTSIVRTDPTVGERLTETYGKLQELNEENIKLRTAIPALEKRWNECDQARQAALVQLQRTSDQADELAQENSRLRLQLAAANERLEALEVERLASVDADPDADGPTSVIQGG